MVTKHNCEVCNKEIKDPLYWVDPKFYDVPKKLYLCGSICATKIYKEIKLLFKET
jgi:hypothetical protein